MKNSSFFLFIILSNLFGVSCDQVRDHPVPSEIPGYTPATYRAVFDPMQPVSISLFDSLPFKHDFTLKLENPSSGTLEKGAEPGQYIYKPNHLSVVRDEAAYVICQGSDCKSGKIVFEVSPVTCSMRIHEDHWFHYLRDTIFLPVQDNDTLFCPDIRFNNFQTQTPGARIFGDHHFAAVIPPPFFSGTLKFSYTMSNGVKQQTARVELETKPDTLYCDKHFQLTDDVVVFPASASGSEIPVFITDLLANDKFCQDYINPASLEIFTDIGQQNLITYNVAGNQIHFQIPGGINLAGLSYRLRNLSGTKTKTARIQFRSE